MHFQLAMSFWHFLGHDLFHPLTGPSDAHHGGYLFWSGIAGSFILGGGIWVGIVSFWRHHNCHVKRCPRLGRHSAAGGKYMLCSKHHPTVPRHGASLADIHVDHHEWLRRERVPRRSKP